MITGVMVLLLAVLAMPVMLRFFAWSGARSPARGGGSAFVGAAGAMSLSGAAGRAAAVTQAAVHGQLRPRLRRQPPDRRRAAGAAGAALAAASGAGALVSGLGAVLSRPAPRPPPTARRRGRR